MTHSFPTRRSADLPHLALGAALQPDIRPRRPCRGNAWQQVVEACRLPKPGAVAQYRSLTAQRRLGGPLRIRRPGDAGEHAVALLLHPARRPWHGDLDAVHAIAEVAVLAGGRMIGAELHVPLPTQLQPSSE